MHIKEGDGPQDQPAEGVTSVDALAAMLDSEDAAPVESEGEDADEAEGSEPQEASEDEPEAEEATFTIKVDGKDVSLKQSELIAKAQQGFDYTKKTMAVAEERKAVEAEKARVAEIRTQREAALTESVDRLTAFKTYLQEQVGSPPPIEWAQQDAAYYLAQKELFEQRKGQLQQAEAAIAHLTSEKQRERQAFLTQTANASIEALRGTLPGFSDSTLPDLEKYVHGYGLTLETAEAGYVQKGLWELAHKAKAYDALLAEKAKLKPVSAMPKVIKTGNPQPPQLAARQEAMKAHKARPSLDSLAKLL